MKPVPSHSKCWSLWRRSPANRRRTAAWLVPWKPNFTGELDHVTLLWFRLVDRAVISRRCRCGLPQPPPAASRSAATGQRIETVELEVPVPPVHGPLATRFRVMEADDREPSPVGSEIGPPRRPALEHGHEPIAHVELVANLPTGSLWQPVIATLYPPAGSGDVGIGEHLPTVGRARTVVA